MNVALMGDYFRPVRSRGIQGNQKDMHASVQACIAARCCRLASAAIIPRPAPLAEFAAESQALIQGFFICILTWPAGGPIARRCTALAAVGSPRAPAGERS